MNRQEEESFLNEMKKVRDNYASKELAWYKSRAWRSMMLFRTSDFFLIILSAIVPLLAVIGGASREIVLPVVSVFIAILTGLNAFYQWQTSYPDYRKSEYAINHMIALWELKITEAKRHPNQNKRLEMVIRATENLIQDTIKIRSTEREAYFERIRPPDVPRRQ